MIELDNFILHEYSNYDGNHIDMIDTLNRDRSSSKYLGNLNYMIERTRIRSEEDSNNKIYVAYYNSYIVGFVGIAVINAEYNISVGILPKYRKEYLGALLIDEFSSYLIEDENYPYIVAMIDEDNTASIRLAESVSYVKTSYNKYIRR